MQGQGAAEHARPEESRRGEPTFAGAMLLHKIPQKSGRQPQEQDGDGKIHVTSFCVKPMDDIMGRVSTLQA